MLVSYHWVNDVGLTTEDNGCWSHIIEYVNGMDVNEFFNKLPSRSKYYGKKEIKVPNL